MGREAVRSPTQRCALRRPTGGARGRGGPSGGRGSALSPPPGGPVPVPVRAVPRGAGAASRRAMAYDERLARFRQAHLNPFNKGPEPPGGGGGDGGGGGAGEDDPLPPGAPPLDVARRHEPGQGDGEGSERPMDLGLAEDHFSRPVVSGGGRAGGSGGAAAGGCGSPSSRSPPGRPRRRVSSWRPTCSSCAAPSRSAAAPSWRCPNTRSGRRTRWCGSSTSASNCRSCRWGCGGPGAALKAG